MTGYKNPACSYCPSCTSSLRQGRATAWSHRALLRIPPAFCHSDGLPQCWCVNMRKANMRKAVVSEPAWRRTDRVLVCQYADGCRQYPKTNCSSNSSLIACSCLLLLYTSLIAPQWVPPLRSCLRGADELCRPIGFSQYLHTRFCTPSEHTGSHLMT